MTLTFELRVTDEHNSISVDTVNVTIHDSSKTEMKTVEKTDPVGINVAGSNNNTEEDEDDTAATVTTNNATKVTLEVTRFGSLLFAVRPGDGAG